MADDRRGYGETLLYRADSGVQAGYALVVYAKLGFEPLTTPGKWMAPDAQ